MTELTNKAIEKLLKMNCKVISLQYPFIVFSNGNDFYKCKDIDIMIKDEIWELTKTSLPLITIKDLK